MKHLCTIAAVCALAGAADAQQTKEPRGGKIEWRQDMEEALQDAKRAARPCLLYFTAEAESDLQLDAAAFSDEAVVRASKRFVRIMVCCPKGATEPTQLMTKYGAESGPTIVYLDAKGVVIGRLTGLQRPQDVEESMRRIAARAIPGLLLAELVAGFGREGARIRRTIERLGDDDIQVRDRASAELKRLKEALDAALQLAELSDDAEIRARASSLLRRPKSEPVVVPVKP